MRHVTSKTTCLAKNKCKVTGFTCTPKAGASLADVFVSFALEQIMDLSDPTVLSDDVAKLENSRLDITRRRRDTTLSRSVTS